MKLTHILEEVCPICGSEPVQESRKNRHTNGHYNESRKFSCGLEIVFSTNFMRTEHSQYCVCSNDQKEILRKKKMQEAAAKLIQYIEQLDCDDDFKEDIVSTVEAKCRYTQL